MVRWYNLLGFGTWAMEPAHLLLLERRTSRTLTGLMSPDHGVQQRVAGAFILPR
jgi:hypothetical protein